MNNDNSSNADSFYNFAGLNVLVLGLGRSGIAASRILAKLGANVNASDRSTDHKMVALADELSNEKIKVFLGSQGERLLEGINLVIASPGVPSNNPVILYAKEKNIPIWSEIELAYKLAGNKEIIAITGTNGKTTTTTLIGKIFEAATKKSIVAGNIGTPLVSIATDSDIEVLIVEVSSFQLDTIVDFKPKISVLLNITEDHLDWHPDFEDYVRAKSRIFLNQTKNDYAIVNFDDPVSKSICSQIKATVIPISKNELEQGVFIKDGKVVARLNGILQSSEHENSKEIEILNLQQIKLKGGHNLDNVMASVATSLLFNIDPSTISNTISDFKGLSHRIEFVASVNGVEYYDDSKATNVDATVKALLAFDQPLVLMVGGRNKGNSFKPLAKSIKDKQEKIIAIVGFGEAGEEILEAMPSDIKKVYNHTVEEAVVTASKITYPGSAVLFSPACASFDAFSGYAERGDTFKRAVLELKGENT